MSSLVDVWVGFIKSKRDFNAYIKEFYGDDDETISQFAEDQGETFYDHDFVEAEHFGKPKELREVLKPLSHSSGFIDEAARIASSVITFIPNCVFADYDHQFKNPRSVENGGISFMYLGRFEFNSQAESVAEIERNAVYATRSDDADITLKVRSGPLVYQGSKAERIPVAASKGLVFGKGKAPVGREFLDLGYLVPGIADLQAEIRYSPEKRYWEYIDLASNGLTHYRKEPINGETVAPFEGIRFSFGDVEFEWSPL
ncbi:MAG: immunity 22 family protein [Chlorobia bacterium]|nr:immunity 22 family protein [Fimbriimonadaceae bacterium]